MLLVQQNVKRAINLIVALCNHKPLKQKTDYFNVWEK